MRFRLIPRDSRLCQSSLLCGHTNCSTYSSGIASARATASTRAYLAICGNHRHPVTGSRRVSGQLRLFRHVSGHTCTAERAEYHRHELLPGRRSVIIAALADLAVVATAADAF